MSETSIVRSTFRALMAPRRLVPVLAVCATMLVAQSSFSVDPLAVPLGVLMCAVTALVAPVSYRVLFPDGLEANDLARLGLYGTISTGVVLSVGAALPKMLSMQHTFLTARPSLLVCAALFMAAGWGLGRDIGFEETLAKEKARTAALQREAERTQLLALRSHLDPHFLFNTLNAIAEWCRTDGEVAEQAVLQLSQMLRSVLSGVRAPTWPLQRELELLRTLFSLHLLRDKNLFPLEENLPQPLPQAELPPLLLLPLAENAVKHGPAAGARGVIRLSVEAKGEALHVSLENPGIYRGPREGSEGLPTVRARLQQAYGPTARMEIGPSQGDENRTRVTVVLPAHGPLPGVVT